MLNPHLPQNLEFWGKGVEHRGQGNDPGISPGLIIANERLPHLPQKRTPSANLDPHFVQPTIPGIRLDVPPLLLP